MSIKLTLLNEWLRANCFFSPFIFQGIHPKLKMEETHENELMH